MKFTLPNGLTGSGILFNQVYLEELTGKQQNYLINTKYKSPIDHIEPLLIDLVKRVESEDGQELDVPTKDLINKHLSIEDTSFILAKLREISFGETYILEKQECPHCQKTQDLSIDLSSLEIIKGDDKENTTILPKSGLEVEYTPISFGKLKGYSSDPDQMLNNAVTSTLSMVVKRIGENSNVTEESIMELKALDNNHIQKNVPQQNHLDTKITHECNDCAKDFDIELEVLSSDFFVAG